MSVPENDPRLRDAGAREENRGHIDPDASPDVIESQIDAKRADISRTLSQLEQRFSPNQMMDYVRDNGGEVAENLGRSFKRNPVPFIVTGIGLAWLMSTTQGGGPRDGSGGRNYRSRYYGEGDYGYDDRDDYDDYGPVRAYGRDPYDRQGGDDLYLPDSGSRNRTGGAPALGAGVSDTTPYGTAARSTYSEGGAPGGDDDESLLDKARAKAGEIGESVGESVDSMKAGAAERRARTAQHYERMRTDARYRAETLRRDASDRYAAMRDSGRDASYRARRRASQGMNEASEFLQEQPLVAAAVGIAVGALIGSLLPATRTEDRYLGEYADDVRGQAADAASEQAERLKGEAARVARDARESAEQGLSQARQTAEENLKGAREKAEEGVHRADEKADQKGEQAVAKADEKTTRGGGTGSTTPSV